MITERSKIEGNSKQFLFLIRVPTTSTKVNSSAKDAIFTPSLGIAQLWAYMVEKKIDVKVFDLATKIMYEKIPSFDIQIYTKEMEMYGHLKGEINKTISENTLRLIKDINFEDASVVGISLFDRGTLYLGLDIARFIKEKYPDVKIVLGGTFCLFENKELLDVFDFIDYVVIGQGEEALELIMKHNKDKDFESNIPNLFYKDGKNIKFTFKRENPIETNCCPKFDPKSKDYVSNDYEDNLSTFGLPYQISRGCINNCSFCGQNKLYQFESKSVEKIYRELKFIKETYGVPNFYFVDNCLNAVGKKKITDLCLLIKDLGIKWNALTHLSGLNKEDLILMKEAGCEQLMWGLESGSPKILQSMNKNSNIELKKKILKWATEVGIKNKVYVIVGYVNESSSEVKETLSFLEEMDPYIEIIQINIFHLTKNSLIYNFPSRFDIEIGKGIPEKFPKKFEFKVKNSNESFQEMGQRVQEVYDEFIEYIIVNEKY